VEDLVHQLEELDGQLVLPQIIATFKYDLGLTRQSHTATAYSMKQLPCTCSRE
jgi:hypothetical protein